MLYEKCSMLFFIAINSRDGEGADSWQNHIILLFKGTYSSSILLLLLCQILKGEGKFHF